MIYNVITTGGKSIAKITGYGLEIKGDNIIILDNRGNMMSVIPSGLIVSKE